MLFTELSLLFNIAIIILFILCLAAAIWGVVLQIQIMFRYLINNRRVGNGKTAKQVAEEMLTKLGYNDIEVCRASYFWMVFFPNWGNRYSPRRKKILLYNNILNKDSVTAVALATQKVGLVVQHREGERNMAFRAKWELWTRPAPNLLLPIVTLGVVIDLILNQWAFDGGAFGIATLIFLGIAVVYTVFAFYALFLIVPTERRAGEIALDIIRDNNLLQDEDIDRVQTLYATYVKKYIADFVMALIELLIDILRLLALFAKLKD